MAAGAGTDTPDEQLEAAAWDLEQLVDGEGEEGARRRLTEALERSRAFAESYSGRLEELDSDGLAEAMRELAEIQELAARGGYFAALAFSTNTADPQRGALLAHSQEQETAIQTALLFFELQWAELSDERAEQLLAGEGLDFCRHHLRSVRRYRNHLLSEPEEKVLTEKNLTGAGAWTRLFEELTAAIRVSLPGRPRGRDRGPRRGAEPADEPRAASSAAPPPGRSPRRWPRGCGRGPTCSTRCSPTRRSTTACAATPTGWRPATSPTKPATSPSTP